MSMGDLPIRLILFRIGLTLAVAFALIAALGQTLGFAAKGQGQPVEAVQVVLLIDGSASIANDAMSRALSVRVARSLADYLQTGAQTTPVEYSLARATFADQLTDVIELRRLPDPIFARDPVIQGRNTTDFVPPLRFASEQLTTENGGRKLTILLTDGEPGFDGQPLTGITLTNYFAANTPDSPRRLVDDLRANDVEVVILALGKNAPQYQQYWVPLVGDQNYVPIGPDTDLLLTFERLLWPPSAAPTTRPQPLEQRAELVVRPYLARFDVSFLKSSPAISLTLTDPEGKLIPPTQGGDQIAHYQVYELKAPRPGTYVAAWQGVGAVRYWQQEEYWPVEIHLTPSQGTVGEPITLTARLVGDGVGIDAPLIAEIGRPGEITTTLPLLPIGGGRRSRVFWDAHDVGEYTIAVRIATADRPEIGRLVVIVGPRPTPVPTATPTATPTPTETAVPMPTSTPTPTAAVAPTVVTPTPIPSNSIIGPSWESFLRGMGIGLSFLFLAAMGSIIVVVPKLRRLNHLQNITQDFMAFTNRFRDKLQDLEQRLVRGQSLSVEEVLDASEIAQQAVDKITLGVKNINKEASEAFQLFLRWLFLPHGARHTLLNSLQKVLKDPQRSQYPGWDVFARNLAETWTGLWKRPDYRDGLKLRDLYDLLAAFCRPSSQYHQQIGSILREMRKSMLKTQPVSPLVNLLRHYERALDSLARQQPISSLQMISAIKGMTGLRNMGDEGEDWYSIYTVFETYASTQSFAQASSVPLPTFKSGKVLVGIIHVMSRIHGFPNGREQGKEKTKIRAMIAHLHEPERSILLQITENWN